MKCQLWLTLLLIYFSLEISFQIQVTEKFKVCEDGDFQCYKTGECLETSRACDGESDCSDASDEIDCPNSSDEIDGDKSIAGRSKLPAIKITCPDGLSKCSDVGCAEDPMVCDQNKKCTWNETRFNCDKQCGEGLFRCSSNFCIPENYRCDGMFHCPTLVDEKFCDTRDQSRARAESRRNARETELITTLSSFQDSDESSTLVTTKVGPVEKEIEFGNGTEPLKHFQHNSKDSAENSSLFSPSSDSNYFDVTSTETVQENATLTSEHSSEEDQTESSLSYRVNLGPRFELKSIGISDDNISLVNKTYALNEMISTNSDSTERSELRQLSNTVNDQPLLIRLIANLARKKEKITYEVEYVDKTALDKLLSVLYSKSKNDN